MPNAQALRLREALREFVDAYNGDTGTGRSTGTRRQIPRGDRDLVRSATDLLALVDGGAPHGAEQRDTPGSRARDRVSREPGPSRDFGRADARALFGGPSGPPESDDGGNT
jgi:hypothetical protein